MGLFSNDQSAAMAALTVRVLRLEERVHELSRLLDLPSTDPVDQSAPDLGAVRALKAQGRTIEAIKTLRQQQPGLGLAEAKAVVDQL